MFIGGNSPKFFVLFVAILSRGYDLGDKNTVWVLISGFDGIMSCKIKRNWRQG
jgi:hypothetical protein